MKLQESHGGNEVGWSWSVSFRSFFLVSSWVLVHQLRFAKSVVIPQGSDARLWRAQPRGAAERLRPQWRTRALARVTHWASPGAPTMRSTSLVDKKPKSPVAWSQNHGGMGKVDQSKDPASENYNDVIKSTDVSATPSSGLSDSVLVAFCPWKRIQIGPAQSTTCQSTWRMLLAVATSLFSKKSPNHQTPANHQRIAKCYD